MNISTLDWTIIIAFFGITLLIGIGAAKKAGKNSKEFFLSGRNMPWWLLGVSMVATTFSADTPNLVTDIIRKNGVAGNWAWWAFLITGMATVFIYAKLWRRSGITTDIEFYELRYSGKPATFLRAFRAIYLGVFFNVMIMATVLLAGIKIAGIMLGLSPFQTVVLVSIVTVIYSSLGGLRGVILTDFFQFGLSMIGMIAAAIYIVNLPAINGIQNLINHPNVSDKTSFFPDLTDWDVAVPLFFIPIAVQWWSTWYPGAEPGGGGYIAQRMLSAKEEKDAVKATLFFNAAHYALRPWPWILIALGSLIVFPTLESIHIAFPSINKDILAHDLAFPAMLSLLPKGLLGLVIAALVAALMSTISTHLNWGSSYLVNDFYVRFIDSSASPKKQVAIGRISTVFLMFLAAIMALYLTSAMEAFNILLQIGAGTGLLFLLRWFWWRINAFSEISAMVVSFVIALFFEWKIIGSSDGIKIALYDYMINIPLESYQKMLIGVSITTLSWVLVTFFTRPTNENTLITFYELIRPHKIGWKKVIDQLDNKQLAPPQNSITTEILMMFIGCIIIYSCLFGLGYFLYGQYLGFFMSLILALAGFLALRKLWAKV